MASVQDFLVAGILQDSHSLYASVALLVEKKDRSWQFCMDYIAIKGFTIPGHFPIPVVDELLNELHGMSIFSKLEFNSGYYQMHMCREGIPKTAFWNHKGHY